MKHADEVYAVNREEGKAKWLEKGHMNPSYINSFSKEQMSNTFRYSNAAPQYRTSNAGPWSEYEGLLAKFAQEECAKKYQGSMYIFTGTSKNYVGKTPAEKVPATMTEPPPSKQVRVIFFNYTSQVNSTYREF